MLRQFVAGSVCPAMIVVMYVIALNPCEVNAQGNAAPWQNDLAKARAIARKRGKPLFVVFR